MPSHTFLEAGYAVAHNDNGFALFQECEAGTEIATGQPFLDVFTLEQEEEAKEFATSKGYVFLNPDAPEPLE
jgi:hypothetical protein